MSSVPLLLPAALPPLPPLQPQSAPDGERPARGPSGCAEGERLRVGTVGLWAEAAGTGLWGWRSRWTLFMNAPERMAMAPRGLRVPVRYRSGWPPVGRSALARS